VNYWAGFDALSANCWLIIPAGCLFNAFGLLPTPFHLANAWINQSTRHISPKPGIVAGTFGVLLSGAQPGRLLSGAVLASLAGWPSVIAGSLVVLVVESSLGYLRRKRIVG